MNAGGALMQLFLVVLGGRTTGCNIELHDVRFVAGDSLEATLPSLRRQWFGRRRGLHIDSWQRIEQVDGWQVRLSRQPEPKPGPQRLWFVNLGAYDPASPAELHAFGLFVAPTAAAACARAKRRLLVGALQQHKDDICPVDDCLAIEQVDGWQLQLSPATAEATWEPLRPDWFGYRRIDRDSPPPDSPGTTRTGRTT
ncbi:MAG: DUF1543 domain-containing protein [Synechococcaceae cyanobacterium]|nr:DUF1543 domain-containing protein [Synechococcaceae cyanobacterium]